MILLGVMPRVTFPMGITVAMGISMPVQLLGVLPGVTITRYTSHNQSDGGDKNKKANR